MRGCFGFKFMDKNTKKVPYFPFGIPKCFILRFKGYKEKKKLSN